MFSPLQSLIDGSFLRFLDPGKIYDIYTDINYSNREILSYTKALSLDSIIGEQEQSSDTTTATHIICITTKLTHRDILRMDAEDTRPKLWLSLHPGIMSIIHKYTTDEDDIPHMLSQGYSVSEPYDRGSFIQLIGQSTGYGRIIDTFLPDSIEQNKKVYLPYTIINEHGHYHDTIILSGGSSIASVTQSIAAGDDGHQGIIIIAQGGWTTTIDDETIVAHIKHASRLIIVLEHKATEGIRMYYDILIKQYNPTIQLSYLFPQYNLMNSILPDYSYELVGFDSQRIREYLNT